MLEKFVKMLQEFKSEMDNIHETNIRQQEEDENALQEIRKRMSKRATVAKDIANTMYDARNICDEYAEIFDDFGTEAGDIVSVMNGFDDLGLFEYDEDEEDEPEYVGMCSYCGDKIYSNDEYITDMSGQIFCCADCQECAIAEEEEEEESDDEDEPEDEETEIDIIED